MSDLTLWLTLAIVGALTLALRASFILLLGERPLPLWLARALRFVPAAVLSALVVPSLLLVGEQLAIADNPRFWAGLLAGAIAWRTSSILATIGTGMAALWLLEWLLAAGR